MQANVEFHLHSSLQFAIQNILDFDFWLYSGGFFPVHNCQTQVLFLWGTILLSTVYPSSIGVLYLIAFL